MFYDYFSLDWTRKSEKKDFKELVCQVNPCPCLCWFSMKMKIIGKFCFIIANSHFLLFCVFLLHCLVCLATSSWIFTSNVEKCDFK